MTCFVDLPQKEKDQTRLYWMLVIAGPLTMRDLRAETNWTTSRTNDALYRLRKAGCVRLVERGLHVQKHHFSNGGIRCGKWEAVVICGVDQTVVDAILES